jgi:hypothetical protein
MKQTTIELVLGVFVSIVVLLIFAADRLDGDELYKGLAAGATCVGAIKAVQSKWVKTITGSAE